MVNPEDIQLTMARLDDADEHYPPQKYIADQLEAAARILRHDNYNNGRLDSVAWRVADAGLILRCLMEDKSSGWSKVPGVQGINCPTGMGAMLPQKAGV